ncbi:hypothetical protein [Actomonas aquatica]|uniref:Uncharacterized protein n=1 Tax=Actomonas aquatica TaxID=2866162 RepID=A0ABZ1C2J2_9BACT|nr:hypothetical protein [Opitutus sp. WL0086]WRQ85931.1 hypothetical protein K1X11_014045 [Opitutus sp. WL0086]
MAWRIDEAVVRGEIDNRERDRVVGRIWFVGRDEPVELALKGNPWRDIAGRRLVFINPEPSESGGIEIATRQEGVVGDITASRKVKVPDIPISQIGEYYAAKKEWTWHWGNALYLEWISEANGRVVIETASFELRVEGEGAWEMSAAEEVAQREANQRAIQAFFDDLIGVEEDDEESGEEVAFEANWEVETAGEEDEGEDMRSVDEMLEGADADEEDEWDDFEHPLVTRAVELSDGLVSLVTVEDDVEPGPDVAYPERDLLEAVAALGPILAEALNGLVWPPPAQASARILQRLRQASGYAEDALAALEDCVEDQSLELDILGSTAVELADIAEEISDLITELRERLEGKPGAAEQGSDDPDEFDDTEWDDDVPF